MKEHKPRFPRVTVHWRDPKTYFSWQDGMTKEDWGAESAELSGYLIAEDEKDIHIASTLGEDNVADVTSLPRGCVERVEKL